MKIGDFAKKYDLNITTVRYYVERALLTPERKKQSVCIHTLMHGRHGEDFEI